MQSMVNRWKTAIEKSESKYSRMEASSHKIEESRDQSAHKNKESKMTSAQKTRKTSTTPSKMRVPANSRIDICAMAIIDVTQPANPDKARQKVKALLEDMLQNVNVERETGASRVNERAFTDLQNRYIESEKERQYLKGKDELHNKRIEALERQLSHYARMDQMLEAAVTREDSLNSAVEDLRKDKAELQKRLKEQEAVFSKEVIAIRELVDGLKQLLPSS